MKKIDKLYLAALRASVKSSRRVNAQIGLHPRSGLRDPAIRTSTMTRARSTAKSQLSDIYRQAQRRSAEGKRCPEKFFRSYLETALWSSTDESDPSGGQPLDSNYSVNDFTQEALRKARKDCDNFYNYARAELAQVGDDGQNGHDFWLTRNGHGAGFWDRGYGKIGDELSKKAKSFGDAYIMVNRGRLHYEG